MFAKINNKQTRGYVLILLMIGALIISSNLIQGGTSKTITIIWNEHHFNDADNLSDETHKTAEIFISIEYCDNVKNTGYKRVSPHTSDTNVDKSLSITKDCGDTYFRYQFAEWDFYNNDVLTNIKTLTCYSSTCSWGPLNVGLNTGETGHFVITASFL